MNQLNMISSTISVIIPAYNAEKYLSQAIESVLNQTLKPLEIIVIDDGSTDGTKQVLEQVGVPVIYIYQDNKGPASARNQGIQIANGEYLSFLDADDVWHPKKLEHQANMFLEYEHLSVTLGLSVMSQFDSLDILNQPSNQGKAILALSLGCATIKKTTFNEVGLLDESFQLAEDLDWFYRARDMGKVMCVQKEIAQYCRRHEDNMTKNRKRVTFYQLKMMKKTRDRKIDTKSTRMLPVTDPTDVDQAIKNWHTV